MLDTQSLADYVQQANENADHRYAGDDGPHAVQVAGVWVELAVEIHDGQPRLRVGFDTDGADDELIAEDGSLHYVFEHLGYQRITSHV